MIWRCIIILLIVSKVLPAQNLDSLFGEDSYLEESFDSQVLEDDKWGELVEDLDYGIEEEEGAQSQEEPERNYSTRYLFSILAIIALAIIIAVAVAYFSGFMVKNKKVDKKLEISIEEAQQNVLESDLDDLLGKALKEESYTLAARLYFLKALKELAKHKRINWNKDKTNRKYYYELGGSPLATPFASLSLIFDRLTYRGDTIDRSEFLAIEAQFQSFFQAIPQTPQSL